MPRCAWHNVVLARVIMAVEPSFEKVFHDLPHGRIIELLNAQGNSSTYSVCTLPPVKPKAGDVYVFVPSDISECGMSSY